MTERLRGAFTTRRYTNPRLPLPYWVWMAFLNKKVRREMLHIWREICWAGALPYRPALTADADNPLTRNEISFTVAGLSEDVNLADEDNPTRKISDIYTPQQRSSARPSSRRPAMSRDGRHHSTQPVASYVNFTPTNYRISALLYTGL